MPYCRYTSLAVVISWVEAASGAGEGRGLLDGGK